MLGITNLRYCWEACRGGCSVANSCCSHVKKWIRSQVRLLWWQACCCVYSILKYQKALYIAYWQLNDLLYLPHCGINYGYCINTYFGPKIHHTQHHNLTHKTVQMTYCEGIRLSPEFTERF